MNWTDQFLNKLISERSDQNSPFMNELINHVKKEIVYKGMGDDVIRGENTCTWGGKDNVNYESVTINIVGDRFYSTTHKYNNDPSSEEYGVFGIKITSFPHQFGNAKYNSWSFKGHNSDTNTPTSTVEWIAFIENLALEGIKNGQPVDLTASHSWTTTGLFDGKFMYGDKSRNGKISTFKPYNEKEELEESAKKAFLEFISSGLVSFKNNPQSSPLDVHSLED